MWVTSLAMDSGLPRVTATPLDHPNRPLLLHTQLGLKFGRTGALDVLSSAILYLNQTIFR
jgi:hypothetical protein